MPPSLPAWMVDHAELTSVLAKLRLALQAMVNVPAPSPTKLLFGRYAGLADRLETLVLQLRALDLRSHAFSPEYGAVGYADKLGPLIEQLRVAWKSLALATLGDQKAALLRRLLALPVPDALGILGRSRDENSHSDVLRWLLDWRTAKRIAPAALRRLVHVFDNSADWLARIATAPVETISVRREVKLGRESGDYEALDRIDILISGPDFLLGIENKVESQEHGYQTTMYWNWLDELPPNVLRGGIFLTPTGSSPSSSHFRSLSYLQLVEALLEAPAEDQAAAEDQLETSVLAGYLKALASDVLRYEMRAVLS